MVDYIDLHTLTLEELSGVVNVYPWFGAARKLLCERMKEMGALSDNLLAQTALYVGDRSILYYMVNGRAVRDPAVDYERARRVEQERLARESGAGAAAGVGSAAADVLRAASVRTATAARLRELAVPGMQLTVRVRLIPGAEVPGRGRFSLPGATTSRRASTTRSRRAGTTCLPASQSAVVRKDLTRAANSRTRNNSTPKLLPESMSNRGILLKPRRFIQS